MPALEIDHQCHGGDGVISDDPAGGMPLRFQVKEAMRLRCVDTAAVSADSGVRR